MDETLREEQDARPARGEAWTREDLEATMQLEQLTARHATMQMDAVPVKGSTVQVRRAEIAAEARRKEASRKAVKKARARAQDGEKEPKASGGKPAARPKRDPLRYAANLIALAALLYLALTALLRLGAGGLFTLFHKGATLENPIAVPEWVLGMVNLLLPVISLWASFWFLRVSVKGGPMKLRISLAMPKKPALWAFVPVVLGVSLVGDVLASALQRFLYEHTLYDIPEAVHLPAGGFATFLYFLGICVAPAVFEELLVRGAMQQMLSRWGAWFSIIVSSVVFTLMHGDIAQMPSLFVVSVLMGLASHCTGTLAMGMALHFANNTMAFCFLYATQKMDGVSALALTGYLMLMFLLAAVLCAVFIHRNKVLSLFNPIPRVYDPKNRQSRLERLATTPLFLLVMLALAARAVLPLFVALKGPF